MLLNSLFPRRARLGKRGPWRLSETPEEIFGGRQSASGASVSEEDSLSLSAIFAGVMLLSRVLGCLPLNVFRRTTMFGREAREMAKAHPATWILGTELNPEMTACIGRRVLEFHRLLWGNGYAKIVRDAAGGVVALWPIEPWRVRPDRDGGRLHYRVDGSDRVELQDMVHVPLLSMDGVRGRSFVDFAVESLGMSISAQEFSARFFANDASPGVILEHPGNPTVEARKEFRRSWNEQHQGPRNSRRTAVLWGGWKIGQNQSISPKDAELLNERRFGVEETARWLNIPPHLLRDLSRATFSNIEHQGIDFVVYSIGLNCREWEQEYDRKLLDPPDLYCKHNVNALMRGDAAGRAAFYSTMTTIGAFSINDVLNLEDRNPIPGGDVHYVPLNMTPVQPEPVQAPAPAPVHPPE